MNSLAQYLQMFQSAPRIGGGSGFTTFGSPAHAAEQERLQQFNNANMQRSSDLDYEDRRSMIDARNRMSQSFSQPMPEFYGDAPRMPEYQQQPRYQFGNALARMVR